MKASSVMALLGATLLLGAACWWLLRHEAPGAQPAPAVADGSLRGPDSQPAGDVAAPVFQFAPPVSAEPIALPVTPSPAGVSAPSTASPAPGAKSLHGRVVTGASGTTSTTSATGASGVTGASGANGGGSAGGAPASVAGAAPVPGALVSGTLNSPQHPQRQLSLVCDADGRFEIPLDPRETTLKSGTLRFTHPAGLGFCRRKVTPEDVARGGDLGDIVLRPARRVPLLVLDEASAPVAGALAVADDDSGKPDDDPDLRSGRTDERGRAVLAAVPLDTPSLSVWAHRFFRTAAALPPADVALDEQHPLVVVLLRSPTLDIVVTDAAGAPQPELRAVLGAQQALFADLQALTTLVGMQPFAPASMLEEVGASHAGETSWSSSFADGAPTVSGSVSFDLDAAGRASISDLRPGVPIAVTVQDSTAALAWGPETVTLQPGEARELRAVIAHAPADLIVRVIDPQVRPLEHAFVEVVREGTQRGSGSSTDAGGLVTLRRVYTDTVTLSVDRPGFVTRRVPDVGVARGGAPFDVILEPGRVVHVVVHDGYGRPVQAESVRALLGGERVGQATLDEGDASDANGQQVGAAGVAGAGAGAGASQPVAGLRPMKPARPASDPAPPPPPEDRSRWLLQDLPPGDLSLEAVVGGLAVAQPHDSRVPQAEVVVPAVGALRVSFGVALDASQQHMLEVQSSDTSVGALRMLVLSAWERSSGSALLPALRPGDYDVALYHWEQGRKVSSARSTSVHVSEGATAVVELAAS